MTANHALSIAPAASPALTPAEHLLACGVVAECGHRMGVGQHVWSLARWTYREWVDAAEVRGFAERRRLRDAMRAGRSTPRGLQLAAAVVERFTPAEVAVLLDRAGRRATAYAAPSLAAWQALQDSPTFNLAPKRLEAAA